MEFMTFGCGAGMKNDVSHCKADFVVQVFRQRGLCFTLARDEPGLK